MRWLLLHKVDLHVTRVPAFSVLATAIPLGRASLFPCRPSSHVCGSPARALTTTCWKKWMSILLHARGVRRAWGICHRWELISTSSHPATSRWGRPRRMTAHRGSPAQCKGEEPVQYLWNPHLLRSPKMPSGTLQKPGKNLAILRAFVFVLLCFQSGLRCSPHQAPPMAWRAGRR